MTTRTRIRNLQPIGHSGRDELERVTAYVDVSHRLLDLRHVTRHTRCRRSALVMRVVLDAGGMRAVRGIRSVTRQTELFHRLHEVGIVAGAMNIVAAEAGDAARVIRLCAKSLPAFDSCARAVREMRERRLAQLVIFELPEALQLEP